MISYFTANKVFLVPFFDLDEEKITKNQFLIFLEKLHLRNIILKYIKNKSSKVENSKGLLP